MVFILVAVGIVIAAIVLALVFIPMLIDESAIIALAQEQVRKATGGELTVEGDVDIALFPSIVLRLGDTALDLPPQSEEASRILAEIESVDIGLSVMALMMGSAEFGDIALNDTQVTLFEANGKPGTQLRLRQLTAERLNLNNNPMGLKGQLEVINPDGREPIVITLDGDIRVPSAVDQITVDALETRITGALTKPVVASLSGNVLLSPLSAVFDLELSTPGGDVAGDLKYAANESPKMDLAFRTQRLNLDALQPAGGDATEENVEAAEPAPQAPPVPVAVGPLKEMDMQLAINADALVTAGQEITNAQLLLRVVDGVTDMKYLRGVLHQGQLDTSLQIDVRKPVIEANVKGSLKGVELNSLLTSLNSPDTALGRVDMDWDIDTEGTTPDALKLGLDGDLTLTGRDVEVTAVSVQDLICQAVAEVNKKELTQPMPETTAVSALGMIVEFDDGKAELKSLDLATTGVELSGSGETSLQSLVFNAKFVAKVNEQLKVLDPACAVNERYMAVDWPVRCEGVLTGDSSKWCRVDADTIVRQLLENEAKSQLQKQAEKLGKDAGSALKKLFGN